MNNFEKNKLLKKKLAGFIRPNFLQEQQDEEDMLKDMRKSNFYRMRITEPSELIKPVDEKHRKKIRKQEEALGIKVLV